MADRLICASADLADGGAGVRFEPPPGFAARSAFAVRYGGRVYAYVNECPHAWTELDWQPGRFFDDSGVYLMCATHGATFNPENGRCVFGPSRGRGLTRLPVEERDGYIYLKQD